MKKLFVDDIRECPAGWDIARSYDEAMTALLNTKYDEISLDHDIASYDDNGKECTGYDILLYLEKLKMEFNIKIPHIYVHTANYAVSNKMHMVAQVLNNMPYKDNKIQVYLNDGEEAAYTCKNSISIEIGDRVVVSRGNENTYDVGTVTLLYVEDKSEGEVILNIDTVLKDTLDEY